MDQGTSSHSNVMQWIVGGAPGVVDAVWYSASLTGSGTTCPAGASGTPNDSNGVNSNCFDDWEVEFAQSRNSGARFRVSDVKELVHIGSLCTQGLNCSVNNGNRNLLDFFRVALDPSGAANVAFADDVSGTVNIEYTRQCTGLSATSTQSINYSCKGSCRRPRRHTRSAASRPTAIWPHWPQIPPVMPSTQVARAATRARWISRMCR